MRPDFRSSGFLRQHIAWMIDYYYPRCIDPRGGYFQFYAPDGAIENRDRRTLVSVTRMVTSFFMAARVLGRPELAAAGRHGLDFLLAAHEDREAGGFAW